MAGILLVWFSCVMFVHLGLGQTTCDVLRLDVVVLRCQKCLSFQTILAYSLLCTDLSVEMCAASSFALAYLALWADLLLSKIADVYEEWSK